VEGVKHVESVSQEGVSSIVVFFRLEVSTQVAAQDIRGKLAGIRGDLPREIEEPIVQRIDPAATPVVSIALSAPGLTPQAATELADKTIKRRLENVAGVGSVNLVGESRREIQVIVDPELEKDRYIYFNAGNHVQTVRLAYEDFAALVRPQISRLVEVRKRKAA